MEVLRGLFNQWIGTQTRRLELNACWRDLCHLAEQWPECQINVATPGRGEAGPLISFANDLYKYLATEAIPPLTRRCLPMDPVVAPVAGGKQVPETRAGPVALHSCPLRVATFNPGRTGFLSLRGDCILCWRLDAVADQLASLNIDICVVPGARLPEGSAFSAIFSIRVARRAHTILGGSRDVREMQI